MSEIRVNLLTAVNAAAIRRETYQGEEHIVLPSYTLPPNVVMNGGLYPAEEIDRAWPSIQGTFAPIGHPYIVNENGQKEWISAFHPVAINKFHGGAWNHVAKKAEDGRVFIEKWVNVAYAERTEGGRRLLAAINKGDPIHTSTGVLLERQEAPAGVKGYQWVARNMRFDHDAILFDEPGAATPEQGVGLMVNTADAVTVNLSEETADTVRDALYAIVRTTYGDQAWVRDFDATSVVYQTRDGYFERDYSFADGEATLTGDPVPVKPKTTWVERIANLWQRVVPSNPSIKPNRQEATEMTKEELAEALKAHGETLMANLSNRLDQQDQKIEQALTANAKVAQDLKDAELRAVVAPVLGEVVANSLSGDALSAAAEKVRAMPKGTAAPLGGEGDPAGLENNSQDNEWGQVPNIGGAK